MNDLTERLRDHKISPYHGGCADCYGTTMDDAADAIDRMREAINGLMVAGNHIATYRTARWPNYQLDGLTRKEQCENALRILGASREYDMWCCWSAVMQIRDGLALHE